MHDDAYMNLMWAGLLVVPLRAAGGVGASQALFVVGAQHWRGLPRHRGFEVIAKDSDFSS
jgi:hypothetical protein